MIKKLRFYIIAGFVLVIGLILIFNEILTTGLILIGMSALIFCLWEFILKTQTKQIENLNQSIIDKDTVEDYSKRKLNISEMNTVLELGLFEVKTNFKRTVNQKFKNQDKNIQFIGVIDIEFIAKYGVDFRKLRFKIDEDNRELFLTNANPEFLAFTKRTCKWEIDEILEFNIPFLGPGHWRTNPKLDKLANQIKENVRMQVEKDSENGPEELKWITEPLRNHVERALQLILGAQGYKIRFTELAGDNYKSFQEYIDENSLEQISTGANNKYKPLGE